MERETVEYAVEVDVPGIKVRIKSERCTIWLCVTAIVSLGLLLALVTVVRAPVRTLT